jgi:hypothetical protein
MSDTEKKIASESKEAKVSNCICLKCYKPNCKSRSNPREYCPKDGPHTIERSRR